MSNDVQSHESVVERLPGEERRATPRHAAATLGSVTARIIGGSAVDLVNFSARGVLFECDSRLLIGARASVRITTPDANMIVSGRVVRSRVKGLVNGALRYDAALALDHELTLRPMPVVSDAGPAAIAHVNGGDDEAADDVRFESELDGSFDPAPVEAYLAASEASLAEAAGQGDPEAEAIALFEGAPVDDVVADPVRNGVASEAADLHVEVSVHATLEEAQAAAPALVETDPVVEAAIEADADEPIAFEADAGIAFEAAEEFVFDEAFEPASTPVEAAAVETPPALPAEPPYEAVALNAIEAEPAGESMFDATPFVQPTEETGDGVSMFDATPPRPVSDGSASSAFDARPSDTWRGTETGEPATEAAAVAVAEAEAGSVDFETDVAFEADDAVVFESALEAVPIAVEAEPVPVVEAAVAEPVAESLPTAALEPLEAGESASDDRPAAASDDDDRALLPFTSTVPVDLADLRRIAADNQW